jgi:O-antigen/teichoic acid export membrane protein
MPDAPSRAEPPASTSFRRVALLATGETFGRGMTWLTVFVLPWVLATEQYGIVVLLATFEGVATGVLLLGQDSAIFWRCASPEEPAAARRCVTGAAFITAAACALALAGVSIAALTTGGAILGVPLWPHIWLLTLGVLLGNVNRVGLAFARASGRTRAFVLDRGAVGAGRFGSTLGLAFARGSALAFPIGMVVGTATFGLWQIRRFIGGARRIRAVLADVRPLVRFGAPLSAHLLAMHTIAMVDRWVIGAMLGLAAVGSYGWYYMLGSGVVFVSAALSVSYEPLIYREYQAGAATRSLREYLGVSVAAGGAYGLAGSVAALLAAGMVPDSVRADPAIAAIVLLAHWLRPVYLGAGYLLSSVGLTTRVAAISGVAVVVTVAANLALVPRVGVIGGAWATLIGTLALVVAGVAALRRSSMPVAVLLEPTLVMAVVGAGMLVDLSLGTFALGCGVLTVYGAYASGLPPRLLARVRAR